MGQEEMRNGVMLADDAVKKRRSVLRVGHGDVNAFREQPLHQDLERKAFPGHEEKADVWCFSLS